MDIREYTQNYIETYFKGNGINNINTGISEYSYILLDGEKVYFCENFSKMLVIITDLRFIICRKENIQTTVINSVNLWKITKVNLTVNKGIGSSQLTVWYTNNLYVRAATVMYENIQIELPSKTPWAFLYKTLETIAVKNSIFLC